MFPPYIPLIFCPLMFGWLAFDPWTGRFIDIPILHKANG